MKRLLIILSAIFSFAGIQAQYLNNKDVVSISFLANGVRYYLEASGNGVLTQPYPTDDCLWELGITDNGQYTLKDLTTGRFLSCQFTDPSNSRIILANSPDAFSFTNQGSVRDSYMYGYLHVSHYYAPWHGTYPIYLDMSWGSGSPQFIFHSWKETTLFIEKWEQKGAGKPTGHFSPSKIEFTYAKDEEAAAAQARPVSFEIEATTESYYQCVPRQDEALLRRSTGNIDNGQIQVKKIYWQSDSINKNSSVSKLNKNNYVNCPETDGREVLSMNERTYNEQDKKWQFRITPIGASPMGLKDKLGTLERWIDYADNVVVEYTYGGGTTQKAEMRVVRKSYHEEQLPALTFSINPVTYTFSKEEETKQFDVVLIHQHGMVIYNVDNQAIKTEYTYDSVHVNLRDFDKKFTAADGWEKTYRFHSNPANLSTHWLTVNDNEFQKEGNLYITAKENKTALKRSDTLVVTLNKTGGEHQHAESFKIPLSQRGVEGGIQFKTQQGKGNNDPNWKEGDEQQVHTAERTIYYLPNQEIELRLPESGYSGYMRWYDYETGGDPYYNYTHEGIQATSWVRSPRGNQDKAFSAINTPRKGNTPEEMNDIIANEGHSHGLYSLNKADGGALDEDNPYNNNPIIKGWADGAAHIMACDVSAYTDYNVEVENSQIKSITEPTLSYRQLFHLRPAGEMADTLAARSSRRVYLEEYKYQAPAGKQILLSTEYRHSKVRSHESELCYFYRDNSEKIQRIDNRNKNILKWYVSDADGSNREEYTPKYSAEMDYLIVRNDNYLYEEPKVYTLVLPANNEHPEYLIARFEVEFVDIERQGPTSKTIITQQRINTQYKNLAEINFDGTSSHLPWEQASYGYVYTTGDLATHFKRGADQGAFPFYGEYTILESVNKDWAKGAAHGGTGKALYVDGTMEPGLVASITAKAKICSGQTMYCSAWFCNPAPSGWSGEGNPIFRCNIQGKNKDEQEWHDAGVYFVGELLKGSGWQQIVFPIQTASSYDSTRVSIYNFATTNQGNDFMVDDITLFVSQLPIAAYQGEMACRTVEDGKSSAVAVLRLDYNNITAGSDGYMYYQIYNESYENKENGEVVSKGAAVNLTGDAGYYHDYDDEHGDLDHDHPYGSVHIPEKGFDPEVYNDELLEKDNNRKDTLLIYTSVSAFLDDLVLNNQKHGKAYIRTKQSGVIKWLLYIAHIVENATQEDINKAPEKDKDSIPLKKLFDEHSYVMRMAYTPEELPTAECNLTTPLYATQETLFRLRNSDKKTISHTKIGEANNGEEIYIHTKSTNNCPNDLYFLTSTVINHLAVDGAGGQTRNIAAPIFSDWLIGDPQGDVLSEKAPSRNDYDSEDKYQTALTDYNARLQAAVAGFKKMYGYTHDEVTSAIMYDMRRHTTDDPNSREYNPNYSAKTFEELQPNRFLSHENYEIVKHLYENGWLQLCDTTVHFYLGTRLDKEGNTIGDTVRYWCFPIAETAKTIVDVAGKATEITIKDCNEPHRVTVSIAGGDHYLNIAPIEYAKKTPQQHVQIPTIKVLEGNYTITIPIKESNNTTALGVSSGNISIDLKNLGTDCSFYNLKTGKPSYDVPSLSPGTEHTIRIVLKDKTGTNTHIGGKPDNCRYGYVFLNLQIVPKTLVWQPTGNSFNGWGKNENWKGWKDTNSNNQIDEGELVEGFVPISETNVIIPQLDNSLLYPYIVPEHNHNHYELTIGYDPHHCDSIYFAPGTRIQNQHLLEYNRAFVDMQFPAAKWHLVSAPLQGMVSGDMFVPHDDWYEESEDHRIAEPNPFEVKAFKGDGYAGIRHADAAYAFWEAFYNTTTDGNTMLRNLADLQFTQSNTLVQPLTEGTGYAVYGLGFNENDSLTVRLPKPDTHYDYYTNGKPNGTVNIPYTVEQRGKLAYTATHDDKKMTITLTNKTASEYFLFGNPTMAFVDMHALYLDNKSQWSGVFKTIQSDIINATTPSTMTTATRYLPPMTSALLKASSKATEMTITLLPAHLTLNNAINPVDEVQEGENEPQAAPARRIAGIDERPVNYEALQSELMTIYAFTPKGTARTVLATNPAANDYYTSGEDALFTSSGVENESYVTTPLNMYTVAEQVPMMADVRQGISEIPLGILAASNARSEYMQVAFYLTSNWSRTCYFVDHKTGQKVRIMNGLIISIEMPENHEQRYSIEGPDTYQGSDGVTTSTTQPNVSTTGNKVWAYAPDRSTVVVSSSDLIKSATLYDLTGRLIAQSPNSLITNSLTLHTAGTAGVYIVDVTLRDGSTERAQVIVQ